jgi:hypothetical protein
MIRITHTEDASGLLTFTMTEGGNLITSISARITCDELQILSVNARGADFDAIFRAALNFARNHGINRASIDIEHFFGNGCIGGSSC